MTSTITQNTYKYDRGKTAISYTNLKNSEAYQLISANYWEGSWILALADVLCFSFGGTNKSVRGDGNRKQYVNIAWEMGHNEEEAGLNWDWTGALVEYTWYIELYFTHSHFKSSSRINSRVNETNNEILLGILNWVWCNLIDAEAPNTD